MSLVPAIYGTQGIFIGLVLLSTGLRITARRLVQMPFQLDDISVFLALIPYLTYAGLGFDSVRHGLGNHFSPELEHKLQSLTKNLYYLELLHYTILVLSKLSILLLFRRIFGTQVRWFRISLYTIIALCIAWYVGTMVPTIIQCRPIRKFWDSTEPGTCLNSTALILSSLVMHIVLDLAIFFLPMVIIIKLQLVRTKKIYLLTLFLFGLLACIVTIIRLPITAQFLNGALDVTWSLAKVFLWSVAELGLGLICCSLPTFRPVLNYMLTGRAVIHSDAGMSYGPNSRRGWSSAPTLDSKSGFRKVSSSAEVNPSRRLVGDDGARDIVVMDTITITSELQAHSGTSREI